MRTDADDPARVRDPAVELLLSHNATLTHEWCSRPRRQRLARIGEIRPAANRNTRLIRHQREPPRAPGRAYSVVLPLRWTGGLRPGR